jgi:hypothetical protein
MISKEQLIRSIEQQLDNLSYLNEMAFNYWCNVLYESDDETRIQDQWTPLTLYYLEQDVEFHDT